MDIIETPEAPFSITAVIALVTIVPALLKFKLTSRGLERLAAVNGGPPEAE